MRTPSIIETVEDPEIWGRQFRKRRSWDQWFTLVKALFGLPLGESELAFFRECTGRENAPTARAREGWLIVGRRGGKSRILSLIAAYLATFVDWSPFLAPGERGVITVLASDRRQCRTIMNYLRAFLLETPLLEQMVIRDTPDEIELTNGLLIEVVTCSFKSVRGRTVIAALCDEAAFWADENGANPASEVIAALRPAMATIPGSVLLVASSPYARRGPLYDAWRRYYAQEGSILVWKAATWQMNPSLSRESAVIAEAFEADPASAEAEYGAEFRRDIESLVDPAVVQAAVAPGRAELEPNSANFYFGFADAAGGSGGDSFTACVCHLDRVTKRIVIDAVREKHPPFSPESTIKDVAEFFALYRVSKISLDRYAGDFPSEQFRKHGISCTPCEKPKSDLYKEFIAPLNSGKLELLDNPRLIKQLVALERRTARGGRESIDHPPGQHDDVINAVAGAVSMVKATGRAIIISPAAKARLLSMPSRRASLTGGFR
jgi:hypothetical protein